MELRGVCTSLRRVCAVARRRAPGTFCDKMHTAVANHPLLALFPVPEKLPSNPAANLSARVAAVLQDVPFCSLQSPLPPLRHAGAFISAASYMSPASSPADGCGEKLQPSGYCLHVRPSASWPIDGAADISGRLSAHEGSTLQGQVQKLQFPHGVLPGPSTRGRRADRSGQWGRRSVLLFGDGTLVSGAVARMEQRRGVKFATGYSLPAPKRLDDIMKLDTIRNASPEDVTRIWNDYHIGRGHVSAVMSTPLYSKLLQRSKEHPLFVLPVARPKGFVSMLLQAQMPHLLFTGLEDYKARGAEAAPYFVATHYDELSQSHGLALIRGDVVLPSQLADEEAKRLLQLAHAFYLDDSKFRLVRTFNKESQDFDFKDVLREAGIAAG